MIVDPVTEDEVFERLRPELESQGLTLHRGTLDGMADDKLGRFYITRSDSGEVVEADVELDRRARQAGVLKANEALVPAHGEGI